MNIVGDFGGTWMRMSIVVDGKIGKIERVKTPDSYEGFLKAISSLKVALGIESGDKTVIGMAGIIDRENGVVLYSPNIPYLSSAHLATDISQILGGKVLIENDTALAGLAEAKVGSGAGKSVVAYISIGTGVGGARIDRGEIDNRTFGFEPGHHLVDMCGGLKGGEVSEHTRGQWESLVGGRAVERAYGMPPHMIKDKNVWEDIARKTAVGIYNTILFWSPDIVVMGGSMMLGEPAISVELIKEEIRLRAFHEKVIVPIVIAKHGDSAGLVGASLLL